MRTMRAHGSSRLAEHAAHGTEHRHGEENAHQESADDAERRTAHVSSIARRTLEPSNS
jgi:hypothetical protein